jgi:hypothetical protein
MVFELIAVKRGGRLHLDRGAADAGDLLAFDDVPAEAGKVPQRLSLVVQLDDRPVLGHPDLGDSEGGVVRDLADGSA